MHSALGTDLLVSFLGCLGPFSLDSFGTLWKLVMQSVGATMTRIIFTPRHRIVGVLEAKDTDGHGYSIALPVRNLASYPGQVLS